MRLLVATDLTSDQVKKFTDYFYDLDSSRTTSMTVVPERKKSVKLERGISFCIIITAVNEAIADYLIDLLFNENENSILKYWGQTKLFKVMEESEVLEMQFIEPSYDGSTNEPHFGWCGLAPS